MLYDVVIVGGGVTGCAIAHELMRFRLHVALVDKECEVGFGTSKANSGIIHGGHHTSPGTLKGRLEWEGNRMWDALCEELGFGFKRIGELAVAFDQTEAEALEALRRQGEDKGVTGLEMWSRERLRSEEPNLSPNIVAALHAPTTGVINPYEACFGLIENAIMNGLDLVTEAEVKSLQCDDGIWTVGTSRGRLRTRFVINAAGIRSEHIARLAKASDFTIHPRKGEEYLLDKRLLGFVKRVIFPAPSKVTKGTLIIPTFDGTIMVGPTADPVENRDDLSTTLDGSERVFEAVRRLAPGISERDCIAEFAGMRAPSSTEDFIIRPSERKGFINVAGIQSPGLTAAPAIAVMVRDILANEGLPLEPNPEFISTLIRRVQFSALSTPAQIQLAQKDKRYSHIVCRCECVTEGEIEDAIHRGARTLDGLKFRTRAGMGRCQGGFCTSRCMEMLAKELDIPLEDVTKRGGNTWIVRARKESRS